MTESASGYDQQMDPLTNWSRGALKVLAEHPHVAFSIRAAVAAVIAWLVVQPMWGVADTYPYYAPLGAVIAVSSTVAGAVRESVQGVVAILCGAGLAVLAGLAPIPEVVALAIVVALGSALSGWRQLGTMASWVPTAALFVLIIGGNDPLRYFVGYLGLTSLGAVIGICVNSALPALYLNPSSSRLAGLREVLAEQLDDLAEGLLQEGALTSDEWHARYREIRPMAHRVRETVDHTMHARKGNWRAARHTELSQRQSAQAAALERLALLVEDVASLVIDHERAELTRTALGPALRPYAAHAFSDMAEALRSLDGSAADTELLLRVSGSADKLAEEIRKSRDKDGDEFWSAGTIVTGLRRAISALAPRGTTAALPTDW